MSSRSMISLSHVQEDGGGALRSWIAPAEIVDELAEFLIAKLGPPVAESVTTPEGARQLAATLAQAPGMLTDFRGPLA